MTRSASLALLRTILLALAPLLAGCTDFRGPLFRWPPYDTSHRGDPWADEDALDDPDPWTQDEIWLADDFCIDRDQDGICDDRDGSIGD